MRVTVASQARLLESELVKARDKVRETVRSQLTVSEGLVEQAPGRGVRCGAVECHKYASCSVEFSLEEDETVCQCPEGFTGDGLTSCQPQEDCRREGCEEHADCQYQSDQGGFTCVCREGYLRSGDQCEEEDNSYPSYTDFTSSTVRPWLGSLLTTQASEGAQYQCRGDEDCHAEARCEYHHQSRRYRCACTKGYEGDGWTSCRPGASAGCNILQDCHARADCLYSEANDQHFCRSLSTIDSLFPASSPPWAILGAIVHSP